MAEKNIVSNHTLSLRALNKRRLVAYPSEKNFKIFVGYCKKNEYLRAELLVLLIDNHVSKLSDSDKKECMVVYESLKNESEG